MLSPRHAPDTRRAKVQKTGTGSTIEKQYTNKNKKNNTPPVKNVLVTELRANSLSTAMTVEW